MAKKGLLMALIDNEVEKSTGSNLNSLVAILFKSRNDAHITHLLQRKKLLCEHQALNMYYDEIVDLIDSFCETSMAHGLITTISVPASSEISDTLSYFKDLYKNVETYRPQLESIPFLISGLDDIQTLISQTIYRLEYIQS